MKKTELMTDVWKLPCSQLVVFSIVSHSLAITYSLHLFLLLFLSNFHVLSFFSLPLSLSLSLSRPHTRVSPSLKAEAHNGRSHLLLMRRDRRTGIGTAEAGLAWPDQTSLHPSLHGTDVPREWLARAEEKCEERNQEMADEIWVLKDRKSVV